MEKKITSPVLAGGIVSLILIVESLIAYFTGIYLQDWAQYCVYAIVIAGIVWAVINNAKENKNNVTYGQLFGFGFKVTAVITCLMILYAVLFGLIFPDVKQKILEMARQKALAQPNGDADAKEKGIEMLEKNFTLFIVIGSLFWYLLIGVVSSLIAAAIPKKNPNAGLDNQFK